MSIHPPAVSSCYVPVMLKSTRHKVASTSSTLKNLIHCSTRHTCSSQACPSLPTTVPPTLQPVYDILPNTLLSTSPHVTPPQHLYLTFFCQPFHFLHLLIPTPIPCLHFTLSIYPSTPSSSINFFLQAQIIPSVPLSTSQPHSPFTHVPLHILPYITKLHVSSHTTSDIQTPLKVLAPDPHTDHYHWTGNANN
ncbi:hypothetical protein E2C01_066500 [Portunus trituberculatus]|uniref:Uncharacterized protein n=1 Tax=Portunus trituberculatus TaxID=210409 RepID=A0A5B7HPY5_PORTR|nr:hypothetical protein [Portunus trituberculatus]